VEPQNRQSSRTIHVVIPSYKVSKHILNVIGSIGPEVKRIWVIDDRCPDGSGRHVVSQVGDPRVSVVFNEENLGVGGATRVGILCALGEGADIIVKLDGDGQMDPSKIRLLVKPLLDGIADYSKGNRFAAPAALRMMPPLRILGNAVLSFWSKISSGYWSVNDPTNGFLAISSEMARRIELDKLASRFFFESDLLYRLRLCNARVADIPMEAIYADEKSNLKIGKVLLTFPFLHLRNLAARVVYQYYLKEWSIASLELPLATGLILSGLWLGLSSFASSIEASQGITAGQVTVSSLLIILGVQLALAFTAYDIASEPKREKR